MTGTVTTVTGAASGETGSKTDRRREQARNKKRRQRERRRERQIRAAEAEAARLEADAVRTEARDERLAPAVLRRPVAGADGALLLGARVAIVDGRAVQAFPLSAADDPIAKLGRDSRAIGERQIEAARRLRADWDDVGAGVNVGAVDYLRAGGGGCGGPNLAILDQVAARVRLDAALAWLGAFAPGVIRVVLDCVPLRCWATETGKTPEEAVAWFAAALNRLAGFYRIPPVPAASGLRTLAPPRAAYAITPAEMDA